MDELDPGYHHRPWAVNSIVEHDGMRGMILRYQFHYEPIPEELRRKCGPLKERRYTHVYVAIVDSTNRVIERGSRMWTLRECHRDGKPPSDPRGEVRMSPAASKAELDYALGKRGRTLLLVGPVNNGLAAMIGYEGIEVTPESGWEMIFAERYRDLIDKCQLLPKHEPAVGD